MVSIWCEFFVSIVFQVHYSNSFSLHMGYTSICPQLASVTAFYDKILMNLYLNFLAGKSTILRLLFRFFDPHCGTVRNEPHFAIPNSSSFYIVLHATCYFVFLTLLLPLFSF